MPGTDPPTPRCRSPRTGRRYAQVPCSRLRPVGSNVEILGAHGLDTVAEANFVPVESRERGGRLAYRSVALADSDGALPTLGILM